MKWQLVVERGQRKGLVIPVSRIPFLIGREADCHLRPNATNVSGRHCELINRSGKLVVHSQTRTSGTFVNGRRIEAERELQPGDHLRVGPLEFLVAAPAPTSKPAPRGPLDEDAIGEMLLAMDEEDSAPSSRVEPVASPSAVTPPEGAAIASQGTHPDHQATSPSASPPASQPTPPRETVAAARDLLNTYARRPRTGGYT